MISIKKHFGTNDKKYLYLSGWMIAALRSDFGPLPDQSMHEKTSVASLIAELYTFLRQADARELGGLFRELDSTEGDAKNEVQAKIDNFQTHVVPIIADIDAGFGNAEATYLMAKQMIEAGACCIQIENQVSDEKQCGHQDGKVTVPHSDFLAKINAVRYAFLELGVDDGVIVARTDSLGAGLTKQIAVTREKGDLGDQYNSFLDVEEVTDENMNHGDVLINQDGKLVRPKRLPSNLYRFKDGTGEAKDYFGEEGMLGYVAGVQRKEIRQGIACVKHQNMAGSDMGDDHKEYFAGEAALKASGKDNTMNQF